MKNSQLGTIALLAIAILLLFMVKCQNSVLVSRNEDLRAKLAKTTNQSFEVERLKNGLSAAHQAVVELTEKAALQQGLIDKQDRMLHTYLQTKTSTATTLTHVVTRIAWKDSIRIINTLDTVHINYAGYFRKQQKYYTFEGSIIGDTLNIDTCSIPDNITFTLGKRRVGLLGSKTEVSIVHDNPYITTTAMQSFQLTNKKLYDKPLFWLLLGAAGGVFIHKL